ncbi:MAG: UDP-N-acetylmuramate--L-alanine ligase [Prevotellaceae bacterium]|jgi:UDP-N-acetylmuramate--alanine ligase|nr:UDP-N-acetylmuramate--L-alanine ligase [Prevotellaceae bacterium]
MFQTKKNIYFLGIGGIGMSALARYFKAKGCEVAGYDRVSSELTRQLEQEGMNVHYEDNTELIPENFRNPENTLVVYTPAVPATMSELVDFIEKKFSVLKRSQVLGEITRRQRAICVAGTHGKTTTSTMTAHLLHHSHIDCNAFIGGISKNFEKNLHLSDKSDLVVIEADEYDRSFLTLSPYMAAITAVDPDHLDIYGSEEVYRAGFEEFTSLIQPGGALLLKKGVPVNPKIQDGVRLFTYSINDKEADFYAQNICVANGEIIFDFVTPDELIEHIRLGVPVMINIENGIAAMALALLNGVAPDEIRNAMATFGGVKRRFDFHIKRDDLVFIDDYAHHPQELKACVESLRTLYKEKKICGIFQPHLYTRTRDFADEFAQSLSLLDELVLLDIYPAREKPIPGVTSQMLLDKVAIDKKCVCSKSGLEEYIRENDFEVLATIGAGDIELLVPKVKEILLNRVCRDGSRPVSTEITQSNQRKK